jgi:hypothetical protein
MKTVHESELKHLEENVVSSLKNVLCAVRELSAARTAARLSAFRLAGVSREVRELLKVISQYGC